MSRLRTWIRAFETLVSVVSSYLALSTFLESTLYKTVARGVGEAARLMGVETTSLGGVSTIIPLLLSALVALKVVYEHLQGRPENILSVYQLNLLLVTPEVLSHSRLDWLNLVEQPQLLEPTQTPTQAYLTTLLVVSGYIALYFTAQAREWWDELVQRGVDPEPAEKCLSQELSLTLKTTSVAALSSAAAFLGVTKLAPAALKWLGGRPYLYLALGVPGAILLTASLWVLLWEHGGAD